VNHNLQEKIKKYLGINNEELEQIILTAPNTYSVYKIPKKHSQETRTIAQPAKKIKLLQYWLILNIFHVLPIHHCAMAYMKGTGIKKNASLHKNNSYLTKFDFKNFFLSIKANDLKKHISNYLDSALSDDDIETIIRISCIQFKGQSDLCLSVGAPSSPLLSNSIMFEFDSRMFAWCSSQNIIYSRYADDLAFSTNIKEISSNIEPFIRKTLVEIQYPRLKLNFKKTMHLSRRHQRRITGVIINNEGNISLGRTRKREISALIHKSSHNLLPESEIYRLQGLLGFAKDIEPLFLASMKKKYSAELIRKIFTIRSTSESSIQSKPR